jgi:hypothetical protein
MNQLNLNNPVISILINNASIKKDESNVSGLWNNILAQIGFNILRGYAIYPEKKTNDNTRSDLLIKLVVQNITITIIECKSFVHDSIEGWDAGGTQLCNYLIKEQCQYGIVAIGNKCKFYKINNNFVDYSKEYNWITNFNEIIQQLNILDQTHTFQILQ